MMDPLAALSVAAAVIQFVDFGLTLTSEGVELYESGSLAENDELELITIDLSILIAKLEQSSASRGDGSSNFD